jgi:hypothetical protein
VWFVVFKLVVWIAVIFELGGVMEITSAISDPAVKVTP